MSKIDVRQRMNAQMPSKDKSEKADFIIQNTGDLKALEANCRFIFSLLSKMLVKISEEDDDGN